MSSGPSSIARPQKRTRRDEADESSSNKRISRARKAQESSETATNLGCSRSTNQLSASQANDTSSAVVQAHTPPQDTVDFVHEPLRLDIPSIRLVEILPPSDDGTIRCAIRHTTLDALSQDGAGIEYTCLSYVWGPSTPTRSILINGKSFKVRDNLWKFLRANSPPAFQYFTGDDGKFHELQVKSWFKSLWIDALSIDQESLLERNHQVQQMGRIYSCAARVLSWMGDSPEIVSLFTFVQRHPGPRTSYWSDYSREEVPYLDDFCNNIYWKRAWVTQEVLLARTLFLQAQVIILPLQRVQKVISRCIPYSGEYLGSEIRGLLSYLVLDTPSLRASSSLIENVEMFCDKECADIRDRIYSLISVSGDGSKIAVDYRCGPAKLAQGVFHTMKEDFCLKRVALVFKTLQVERNLSTDEKMLPLISIDRGATLATGCCCSRCGRRIMAPIEDDIVLWQTARYVCLCCQHVLGHKIVKTHSTSHFGHLMIFWGRVSDQKSCGWHLFWRSISENEKAFDSHFTQDVTKQEQCKDWREIKAPKKVISDTEGFFKSLTLSVQAFISIMKYAATFNASDNVGFSSSYGAPRNTSTSSRWRLASS